MPEKKGHHHEEDEEDDDDDDKKEEVVIVVVVVEEGEEEVESIVPRPSLRTVPRFSSHHISYRCIVRYLLSLSLSLSFPFPFSLSLFLRLPKAISNAPARAQVCSIVKRPTYRVRVPRLPSLLCVCPL